MQEINTQIEQTLALAPVETQNKLQANLGSLIQEASEIIKVSKTIEVKSIDQVVEMGQAREFRLRLKKIRTTAENTRKEMKESIVREGKAIDGFANIIKALIEPEEERLEQQEKFAEIQAEKAKDEMELKRIKELSQYTGELEVYKLRDMTEDTYQNLKTSIINAYNLKIEAEKKAEEDRLENERKEAEERERVKAENEKLRKENEEKEKALQAEREANRKLEEERQKKEKEEADKKAKEEADRKAEEKRLRDEEKKKAKMSDTDKVKSIVDILKGVRFPEMKSEEAKTLVADLEEDITKMIIKINNF